MATAADELREKLRERVRHEALADPRVKSLERWALGRPDDEVAEAIELFTIGLDASRKGRGLVLRTIDDEFRRPEDLLPHEQRVAFLQWIVRSHGSAATTRAKLLQIREATTTEARSRIVAAMTGATSENKSAVLVYAWRTAPADARPTGAVHRGEPQPFIGPWDTVRLAIYFARRVAHLVLEANREAFERLLELAASAIGGGQSTLSLRDALNGTSNQGAMGVAGCACSEAIGILIRHHLVGGAAVPAAVKVVGLLLEADGKEAVRSFLCDLDEELRRLDVVHAVERRKKSPSRRIVRAIHRGAENGKVVLWLAELEGGQLGLLSKQGRRWTWNEGSSDDVLATIPDAHFERAVMAAK